MFKKKYFLTCLIIGLILISFCFIFINPVKAEYFGDMTAYSSDLNLENHMIGCNYVSPDDGMVDNITAYLSTTQTTANVKSAIYYYSNHTMIPNGESNVTSFGPSTSWIVFTFATPPIIDEGETYILIVFGQSQAGTLYIKYDSGTQNYFDEISTYPTFENPPNGGWDTNSSGYNVSIYCSYTKFGWINTCPNVTLNYPVNNSIDICLQPTINIDVYDLDGNTTTVCFYENTTGSYVLRQVNNSILNETVYWNYTQANSYSTTFYWRVTIADEFCNVSFEYSFTTMPFPNECPSVSDEYPINNSDNIEIQPTCNLYVYDLDGNTTTVCFYENTTGSYVLRQVNNSILNETVYWNYIQANSCNTTFYWKVTVEDDYGCNVSFYYSFTTFVLYNVYVDDDFNESTPGWNVYSFKTISNGYNAVETNGNIYVWNGTYIECLYVTKSVNFIGNSSDEVFVYYDGMDSEFYIVTDYVNISGFNISNSIHCMMGIETEGNYSNFFNNTFHHLEYGIVFTNTNNIFIFNNTFYEDIIYYDIWANTGSSNCYIYNNYFYDNQNLDIGTNNYFNISKTLGTNIIGGPYLGGNYWVKNNNEYDEDGFSYPYIIGFKKNESRPIQYDYLYDYLPLGYTEKKGNIVIISDRTNEYLFFILGLTSLLGIVIINRRKKKTS